MSPPATQASPTDPALLQLLGRSPWAGRVVVRGELPAAQSRVAVVGTRRPCAEQHDRAMQIGRQLAQMGAVVCSGGAVGIDIAALRGALSAGGRVIAVLPSHPDAAYPPAHRDDYARIVAQGGALLCLDERAVRTCWFLRRNRLLADVVHSLVAVAANLRSGTMMVAREAVKAGDVLAVAAWPAGMPRTDGTAWLAAMGAPAIASDQDLAKWYRDWTSATQDFENRSQRQALAAALHHADLRKAPRARPRGASLAVDADRPGSPSYAAPGGSVLRPVPPELPAESAAWAPTERRAWDRVAQAHPNGQTLEDLVAALGGDRRGANAAVLALSLGGHLRMGPDGTWRCGDGS